MTPYFVLPEGFYPASIGFMQSQHLDSGQKNAGMTVYFYAVMTVRGLYEQRQK
jgi:hypothetical protein